jgi:hypothetical protein
MRGAEIVVLREDLFEDIGCVLWYATGNNVGQGQGTFSIGDNARTRGTNYIATIVRWNKMRIRCLVNGTIDET